MLLHVISAISPLGHTLYLHGTPSILASQLVTSGTHSSPVIICSKEGIIWFSPTKKTFPPRSSSTWVSSKLIHTSTSIVLTSSDHLIDNLKLGKHSSSSQTSSKDSSLSHKRCNRAESDSQEQDIPLSSIDSSLLNSKQMNTAMSPGSIFLRSINWSVSPSIPSQYVPNIGPSIPSPYVPTNCEINRVSKSFTTTRN